MIRQYTYMDYEEVSRLIQENGLVKPAPLELEGYGLVWEEDEEILGFVWGLTNEESATVFVDYFVVTTKWREKKDEFGRGFIAVKLITELLSDMRSQGKTRIIGQLPKDDLSESLARIYNSVGMKFSEPLYFVEGNIETILNNMMEGKHGKQNYSGN